MNNQDLFKVSTADLVNELAKREAVQEIKVNPYQRFNVSVNDKPVKCNINGGPARLFVVWD